MFLFELTGSTNSFDSELAVKMHIEYWCLVFAIFIRLKKCYDFELDLESLRRYEYWHLFPPFWLSYKPLFQGEWQAFSDSIYFQMISFPRSI